MAVSDAPRTLPLAGNLDLPLSVVTEKLAFLAQSGAGKSYAAMRVAELMLGVGAQVVALDPVGIWWSLRASADGDGPGFPIVVFGGDHGDLPLDPDAGAFTAGVIVERGIPVVLDVSEFTTAETKRFVGAFADHFFQLKKRARSPVHLFFEEAQTFAPQMPERDETVMLNRVERLLKLGRNYGVGWSLISQQPQSVNKKVLNQAGTLVALRTIGRHERKAIAEWVADKATSEEDLDLQRLLPTLATGVAHVWSPSFLHMSTTVHISRRATYDSSKTPEFGDISPEPRQLAPVDVASLRAAMADAVTEHTADDPEELRQRIAVLERQLQEARSSKPQPIKRIEIPVEVIVEKPVLPVLDEEHVHSLTRAAVTIGDIARLIQTALDTVGRQEPERREKTRNGPEERTGQTPTIDRKGAVSTRQTRLAPAQATQPAAGVTVPQQRILDALASFAQLGLADVAKSNAAIWSGQSPTSSGYSNNLGKLRTLGLIDYPRGGRVALTDGGRAVAGVGTPIRTLDGLHEAWYRRLPRPQAAILSVVVGIYPDCIERGQLAVSAGQSPTSSGYSNNLGALRSLGLIDYPQPGKVVATTLLFPWQEAR